MKRYLIAAVALATLALPAHAGDIIEEWASVKAPPLWKSSRSRLIRKRQRC